MTSEPQLYFENDWFQLYNGNVINTLKQMPDECVHTIWTSPPYYNLRLYDTNPQIWGGDECCNHEWVSESEYKLNLPKRKNIITYFCTHCGAWKGELGCEPTPELYINHLTLIGRELKRVLRDDGVFWLNIGDSFFSDKSTIGGLKSQDLIGIPWMTAFALRNDGWYLRSDIIWCLSGGNWVYVKSQKGEMPMMLRDLYRLNPKTVKLWNGKQWTQLIGMTKAKRKGTELEIVLRSGERISCTPEHRFPTNRGLVFAKNLKKGDIIDICTLPEPTQPKNPQHITDDVAWFIGMYLAEGSMSEDTIQLSGHTKETERFEKVKKLTDSFGEHCFKCEYGNDQHININGKIIQGILRKFITGKTAKDKGFSVEVWKYSNNWLASLLQGYLEGDGSWDEKNRRWHIGFTRNYKLEKDIRTLCARLNYKLSLKPNFSKCNNKKYPSFRGHIRKEKTNHFNSKNMGEIIEIRKSKCRYVYDLEVEDEPHLFSLASGVLTHNSKKNPMPESVKNRPTKSHEYIFMLAKNKKYYYDHIAILEPAAYDGRKDTRMKGSKKYKDGFAPTNTNTMCLKGHERWPNKIRGYTTKQPSSAESQQHHGGNMSCPKRIYPTGSNQTLHDYPHSGYFKADGAPLFQISTDGIPARNKRDVWVSSTAQFKANQYMENPPADHFAVAPIAIIEPCILAGTSEKGVCSECGNPWKRIITHKALPRNESRTHSTTEQRLGKSPSPEPTDGVVAPAFTTEGWEPSCNCNAGCVPPIVLDPFCGSGTTGVVALKNGRRFIGIDLNEDYCELAKVKIIKDSFRGDKDE